MFYSCSPPAKCRISPKPAGAQHIPVDANPFLFLVQLRFAFGVGCQTGILELESTLIAGFLQIGETTADMTGAGDDGDVGYAELLDDSRGIKRIFHSVPGSVFQEQASWGNASAPQPLAHYVGFRDSFLLIPSG